MSGGIFSALHESTSILMTNFKQKERRTMKRENRSCMVLYKPGKIGKVQVEQRNILAAISFISFIQQAMMVS